MSRLLQLGEVLTKPVIVTCPNSRYHGMVGTVMGCWMDDQLGFELLYEIRLPAPIEACAVGVRPSSGIVCLAFDEFKLLEVDY
ncbi:membrane lipoprotein [Vibrio phage 1.293.O._10N.261.52.E1]|nr:membrane lipoprotein [Vibrio phage 1.293.O._10N.261.52.E1]